MATSVLQTLKQCISELDLNSQEGQQTNLAKLWSDWLQNFEDCIAVQSPVNDSMKRKLLRILGGKGLREKMDMISNNEETCEETIAKLNEYFQEKRNLNSLRSELFATKPKEGETTKCWMERCRIIADQCELDKFSVKEALLLVMCQHTPLKKLQKEILVKDMKFDSAVTYASSLERAAKEQEAMVENRNTNLNKLTNKPKCKKSNTTSDNNSCSRCGRMNPHQCRAIKAKCFNCQRVGHFAMMCRSKIAQQLETEQESFSEEMNTSVHHIDEI